MAQVYVATIDHKHGTNTYVAETYLLAFAQVADFAREWWHQIVGMDENMVECDRIPASPDGLTDDKVVEIYFGCGEMLGDEFYNIEQHDLIQAERVAA